MTTPDPSIIATPATGVAIPIALPTPLGRLRRRWDRAALAGAGPHVTILYPFLPPAALEPAVRIELAALASAAAAWDVRFDRVRRWEDGLVWLEPADPTPFERLTASVVHRWPAYPPYGGLFDEPIVHLTLVESSVAPLADVEAIAQRCLPVVGRASRLELWRQDDAGRWRRHWRLPFGS